MNSTPDWTGVGTRDDSNYLLAAHAYFRARGEDPTPITPDFFRYWAQQGKTPEQMYRIACNSPEPTR